LFLKDIIGTEKSQEAQRDKYSSREDSDPCSDRNHLNEIGDDQLSIQTRNAFFVITTSTIKAVPSVRVVHTFSPVEESAPHNTPSACSAVDGKCVDWVVDTKPFQQN